MPHRHWGLHSSLFLLVLVRVRSVPTTRRPHGLAAGLSESCDRLDTSARLMSSTRMFVSETAVLAVVQASVTVVLSLWLSE